MVGEARQKEEVVMGHPTVPKEHIVPQGRGVQEKRVRRIHQDLYRISFKVKDRR